MTASVVSVSEMVGTGGTVSARETSFTRRFVVKLSEPSAIAAETALHAPGIPTHGQPWPRNVPGRSTPTVRTRSARLLAEDRSRLLWVIEVTYSNARTSGTAAPVDENTPPWNRPALHGSDSAVYAVALERDFSDPPQAVRNSVGDPFDPVPEAERHATRITIQKASLAFNESTAAELRGTLNAGPVTIAGVTYPARACKLLRWTATGQTWTDDTGDPRPYWEHSIEIEVATGGTHDLAILNRGYRARPEAGADPVRVIGPDGNPVPEPVLLDDQGLVTETPVYLTFVPAKPKSWAPLGSL